MAQPPPPQQHQHVEHQREPCPDRIIDDIGGAFGMGAVGGGAWHLIKGLRNSPPGFRAQGALEVGVCAAAALRGVGRAAMHACNHARPPTHQRHQARQRNHLNSRRR
jgi:hypothetical protein